MAFWYFIIGFIASAVAMFVINTARFVRRHYNKNLSMLEVIKLVVGQSLDDASDPAPVTQSEATTELVPVQPVEVELAQLQPANAELAQTEPAPIVEPTRPVADPLDMPAFGRRLTRSADPIAELKDFVRQTRAASHPTRPENRS